MGATVTSLPAYLPGVKTARVAHTTAYAVRALCDRMSVQRQTSVLVLEKDIQRPVVGVPRVF